MPSQASFHDWDDYVPYDKVLAHEKTTSGVTYYNPVTKKLEGDHWGATKPSDRALAPGEWLVGSGIGGGFVISLDFVVNVDKT